MATYSTDFTEYDVDANLANEDAWEELGNGDGQWFIKEEDGAKTLRFTSSTYPGTTKHVQWLRLKDSEFESSTADAVQFLIKAKQLDWSENPGKFGALIGGVHDASDTWHQGGGFYQDNLIFTKNISEDDAGTIKQTSTGTRTDDTWYWIRVDCGSRNDDADNKDTIRVKIWEDGDDEPDSYQLSTSDFAVQPEEVGLLGGEEGGSAVYFDFFSVGTDGDDAPSPNEPPNTPTISVTATTTTTATLESSAFSDPNSGDVQTAAQWQVDVDSGDFSDPAVYDSGETTSALTQVVASPVRSGETQEARVRHKDAESWSSWASSVAFLTPHAVPEIPTIDGISISDFTAFFESSAFSSADTTDVHASSQWLVRTSGDSILQWDSGFSTSAKTRAFSGNLHNARSLEVRVIHKDDDPSTATSTWSSFGPLTWGIEDDPSGSWTMQGAPSQSFSRQGDSTLSQFNRGSETP